jgi:serine/threonine protein kinase
MAPEQIRGRAPDPRTDIYGFGCMLHEMLSGKPPFTGVNSNDLLMKHLRTLPPPLEAFNDNVSSEFAQLVRKCMAKNPSARPNTMEDFLGEFRMMRMFKIQPKPPESE